MAQDLQTESNKNYRLFEKFSSEANAVNISKVSLIIASLLLFIVFLLVVQVQQLKAKVDSEQQYNAVAYRELEREYRLLQAKVDRHRAAMLAAGIDPDFHIVKEPHK